MSDKVIASDFRKTKEVTLPESGITLEIYPSILVGDLNTKALPTETMEFNIEIISKLIKKWNFYRTAEDAEPLPINIEGISLLSASDFRFLVDQIEGFATEQKKS